MYDKRDCVIIASTGFGKSLIYQFPPVYMKKLTIVISPLIALMEDQVLSLKAKGIKACFFGSMQPDKSLQMADHNVVYITPEYLVNRTHDLEKVRDKIAMFAIDEAHLIDQWCDFRPEFKQLGSLRDNFPEIPIVALTATAPQNVKEEIVKSLKLKDNYLSVRTFLDRPNLIFSVKRKNRVFNGYIQDVLPLLQNLTTGSAIVYCNSRKITEEISHCFNRAGLQTRPYNAGMQDEERRKVVKDFRENRLRFVICTIAYGMGIDKGDVRLVVHYGVPKSLEAYYQEAGRAGRDGNTSRCMMYYEPDDFRVLEYFINDSKEKANKKINQRKKDRQINEAQKIAAEIKNEDKKKYLLVLVDKVRDFINSSKCRRLDVLTYLGASAEEIKKLIIRAKCCDNCKINMVTRIPPELAYRDLAEDGSYNFSNDARILFEAVDQRLMRREVVDLLRGEMPSRKVFMHSKLEVFGKGRGRPKDWWTALISLLLQNFYLDDVQNAVCLSSNAKDFLRYKTAELKMKPSWQMLAGFFVRRDDIEFFWNNDKVDSRPSSYIICKVPEDTLTKTKSSKIVPRTTLPLQTDFPCIIQQVESDSLFADEEFSDSDIDWGALKKIEANDKSQAIQEQQEIEALNSMDFEDDEKKMSISYNERQEIDSLGTLDFDDIRQDNFKRSHLTDDEWDQACSSKVLKTEK